MQESCSTALILEDQETILELTALYLERCGHKTIQCLSVGAAVEQFERSKGRVDLLIADVSLPDGSGVKAGLMFWESRPTLKVLFMSGYGLDGWRSDDAARFKRFPQESVRILQKPFSGRELLESIGALINTESQMENPSPQVVEPDEESAHRKLVITALQRQADLLELAHDAIMVRSLDGTIRFWNRGAEALYGWNRDHAVGRFSHELLHTILPLPVHQIERTLRTTGRWDGELHHTARDGNDVIVSSRWAVRSDVDGHLEVLEINRDITAQKKIEEGFRSIHRELVLRVGELSRAEERFRGLLESAPDAMVISNVDGEIALINAQTEAMFGYTRDELVGSNVDVLVPERFRGVHEQHRHGYTGNPHFRRMGPGLKLFGRRKNGEQFPVEISLSPLKTEEGILISSAIRDASGA
jgi:PAS domain S-box-containing protein